MSQAIDKEKINDWLKELNQKTKVIVPARVGRQIRFKSLGKKTKVVLGYKTTYLSVKEYFLPIKEETFRYNPKTTKLTTIKNNNKLIVFGLGLADLEAMTQLDEVMAKPVEDFFYWQRRKNAILIGLTNHKVDVAPGGDLLLSRVNKTQYRAIAVTAKGKNLLKSKFFKTVDLPANKKIKAKQSDFKEMLLDAELLSDAVAWSWTGASQIWDDLATRCLGCGICTYVCPLCFCFSTEDRVSVDGKECSRCRGWDACTLPQFAKVAGNHNFHKSIKERYYNWYYHKFVRAYLERGKSLCVGCGRCRKYCPAQISIKDVLTQILNRYLELKK